MPIRREIADALDRGSLDIAIRFSAWCDGRAAGSAVRPTTRLLLRQGHPLLKSFEGQRLSAEHLRGLDFVAVRSAFPRRCAFCASLNLQDQVIKAVGGPLHGRSVHRASIRRIWPSSSRRDCQDFVQQGGYVVLPGRAAGKCFRCLFALGWRFAQAGTHRQPVAACALVSEVFSPIRCSAPVARFVWPL